MRGKEGLHAPNLHIVQARLGVLLDIDVDGEVGVDVAHLVLEALGHADNQVVDDGAHGAQRGNRLARAMVQLNVDDVLLGARKADRQVAEVFGELAWNSEEKKKQKGPNISSLP
jgi:hypothetical protein